MTQQRSDDQRFAAARFRRGEDDAAGHSLPYQSSVSCRRTTSPIAMIAGLSMPFAARAALASVVVTTRCAAVVALLTIATGSSGARPAAISRAAIVSRWVSAM